MKRRAFIKGFGLAIASMPAIGAASRKGDAGKLPAKYRPAFKAVDDLMADYQRRVEDVLIYGMSVSVDGRRVNPMSVIRSDGSIHLNPKTDRGASIDWGYTTLPRPAITRN